MHYRRAKTALRLENIRIHKAKIGRPTKSRQPISHGSYSLHKHKVSEKHGENSRGSTGAEVRDNNSQLRVPPSLGDSNANNQSKGLGATARQTSRLSDNFNDANNNEEQEQAQQSKPAVQFTFRYPSNKSKKSRTLTQRKKTQRSSKQASKMSLVISNLDDDHPSGIGSSKSQ